MSRDCRRYAHPMSVDLSTNVALMDAVRRAREAAEDDGSLHPISGEHIDTALAVRDAIDRLLTDGTYADAIAAVIAADPELA